MPVNWLTIRNDYINGGGSYRKLAEKYGVSFAVLKDKAVGEKWKEAKENHTNKIRTKTEQKAQEKISDALSDEAASRARIKAMATKMVEGWLVENYAGKPDSNDIRKMVQNCVDALNAFADLYGLAPMGAYDVVYDFGDIVYNREEDRAHYYQLATAGHFPWQEYFVKFLGYSPEEAKRLLDMAKAEQKTPTLFGGE